MNNCDQMSMAEFLELVEVADCIERMHRNATPTSASLPDEETCVLFAMRALRFTQNLDETRPLPSDFDATKLVDTIADEWLCEWRSRSFEQTNQQQTSLHDSIDLGSLNIVQEPKSRSFNSHSSAK